MDLVKTLRGISYSIYFFVSVVLFYLLVSIYDFALFSEISVFFYTIFLKILPIFVLVFFLTALTNYFITPKFIVKHLRDKGLKKWIYVIIGGVLSSGPIYMWYPLLAEFKKKGLRYGLISCFLYNRAIKIPLLPLAILYFGLNYVLVLTVVMIFVSVLQGILLNKFLEV